MPEPIESLIKLAYTEWKKEESKKLKQPHPAPELLAAVSEKPLPAEEDQGIKLHIILCDNCSEALAAQLVIEIDLTQEAPPELIKWAKELPVYYSDARALARIFRLKKKILTKLATQKFISALLRHLPLKNLLINYR
jgi:hypothetical protein